MAVDIDLDKVMKIFQRYAKDKDLMNFEEELNRSKLYKGKGHISVRRHRATISGFVDQDFDGKYNSAKDKLVFKLEVDRYQGKYRLIASDRYGYHRHSFLGTMASLYLYSWMWRRTMYFHGPGYHYRYRMAPRGYYGRARFGGYRRGFGRRGGGRSRFGGGYRYGK